MRKTAFLQILGAAALLGAGLMMTGCKPELTPANAQALIQAEYDHRAATAVSITIDKNGLSQGLTAKYWEGAKLYPNKYWADYKLTPDGAKAVKLPKGGDIIEWRPDSLTDTRFTYVLTTQATSHLKARDFKDLQDEVGGKSLSFSESVNLDGLPAPLQEMAHNASNKLSTKRQADFVYDGGAWKLKSIE